MIYGYDLYKGLKEGERKGDKGICLYYIACILYMYIWIHRQIDR